MQAPLHRRKRRPASEDSGYGPLARFAAVAPTIPNIVPDFSDVASRQFAGSTNLLDSALAVASRVVALLAAGGVSGGVFGGVVMMVV